MTFTLYPDPPVRALAVAAGATVFTAFTAHSTRIAEFDPPYSEVMFLRVAMLDGTSAPTLLVAAGTGTPVEVTVDPQGLFSSPGDVGYVGDVSLNLVSPNVFEVMVGLVSVNSALEWRLGIRNTGAAQAFFTWVVGDSVVDTAQPWVDPGRAEYRVTATVTPVGVRPVGVAIDHTRATAFVIGDTDNSVSLVDLPRQAVVDTVVMGHLPLDIAVDVETHTAYVSHATIISAIDHTTRAVTEIDVAPFAPSGLAIDHARRILYAAAVDTSGPGPWKGAVLVIDIDTCTVSRTIEAVVDPYLLAVDPTTHKLYANDSNGMALWVIDPDSGDIVSVTVDRPTFDVVVDPTTHLAYYAATGESSLIVWDLRSQALHTIWVGPEPIAVAIDPDVCTIYVSNRSEKTVTAVDTRTYALQTISVGESPHGVAVDPANHVIVVAETAVNSASIIERRPQPGSPP
ncbi:MAG: YncE family protein [Candidatus Sericytochromatia bacterium]